MQKVFLIIYIFFIPFSILFSQKDVIKIMTYNLTQFGEGYGGCDQTNNSYINKASYLKTIVENQKPDILAACEIADNSLYPIYILTNSLNEVGKNNWKKAPYTNHGSSIINVLFYDSDKFDCDSIISLSPFSNASHRDINIHRLKHKISNTYFYIILIHLSSSGNDYDRSIETAAIMTWLSNFKDKYNNFLIMGDFNIPSAYNSAFQNLINNTNNNIVFNDPLNVNDNWQKSEYSYLHTQSTRTDNNACLASGGMDDRFDLILVSNSVLSGNKNMKLVDNSYKAVGQDGNRWNSNLTNPINNSLSTNIINALYNLSDHLPVVADFEFPTNNIYSNIIEPQFYAIIENPISDFLNFSLKTNSTQTLNIHITSIDGQIIYTKKIIAENNLNYNLNVNNLKSGCYFISFSGKNIHQSYKIIVDK